MSSDAAPFVPSNHIEAAAAQQPTANLSGNFQPVPSYAAAPAWSYPYPYVIPNSSMNSMQPLSQNVPPMEYQNVYGYAPMYGMQPSMAVPNPIPNSPSETRLESLSSSDLSSQTETTTQTEPPKEVGASHRHHAESSSSTSSDYSYDSSSSSETESMENRSQPRAKSALKLQNQNFFKSPNRQRNPRNSNPPNSNRTNPRNQGNQGNQRVETDKNSGKPRLVSSLQGSNDQRDRNPHPKRGNVETGRVIEATPQGPSELNPRAAPHRRRGHRSRGDRAKQQESLASLPEYRENGAQRGAASSKNAGSSPRKAGARKEREAAAERLAPVMDNLVALSVCGKRK